MRRAINLNEKFDMEHEILDLIDKYWKFDNDQTPVSNWHDKQDLLEAVRKVLRIHDVVGRSEQLPCGHKQVELVRYAAKCKDCGTAFETKW